MATPRNNARVVACRTRTCAPASDVKALLAAKLGKDGKSDSRGYSDIITLVGKMKESNVWGGSIKGYLFKGSVDTSMKSGITSFATSNGWQRTNGNRIIKYGTIIRGGKSGRRHLLIFGYYKGTPNRVYCSLTII
jgi:hypothetical protein